MSIDAGTRISAFEIIEPIGVGGMGEVWLARDTSLKRKVAVKVLPEDIADDTDRMARFQREAEILAALNHPNIAHVYGIEKADNQIAIIMELVEGPTLADRITEGPIPPDQAMGIAVQILAALEAAHDKRIVHRDLKPANIKLKDDGTVKVLDFGISKPVDPRAISDASPDETTPAVTQTGVILGTAAYMSPEQARGKFVDERTDIWAFGCLLFEMLTGQPAFGGEDVMVTLARVLANETNLDSIPGTISPSVRHTIGLCLEKDARKRIADIRDVRLALEGKFEPELPDSGGGIKQAPVWRKALVVAISALVGGVLVGVFGSTDNRITEPKPVTVYEDVIPPDQQLLVTAEKYLALRPDGGGFVYLTTDGIYHRERGALPATRIYESGGASLRTVFFGYESDEVFFSLRGTEGTRRISINGGAETVVWDRDFTDRLGSSSTTTFITDSGNWILSHLGGASILEPAIDSEPESLFSIDTGVLIHGAQFLPDGGHVLFSTNRIYDIIENSSIVVKSLVTGVETRVLSHGHHPRYLDSGHLLYVSDGAVRAVPFDLDTFDIGARDRIVLTDVRISPAGIPQYEIAEDGTLAYVRTPPDLTDLELSRSPQLVWLDLEGRTNWLPIEDNVFYPSLSSDGRSLAVSADLNDSGAADIYVYDLLRPGTPTLITRTDYTEMRPLFVRNERRVIYERFLDADGGLFIQSADRLEQPKRLTTRPAGYWSSVPLWLSEDNSLLVFERAGPDAGADLFMLNMDDLTEEPLLNDPNIRETGFAMSPDMQYFAYTSDETDDLEVYVSSFTEPAANRRIKVSTSGGSEPSWDPAGFIYYLDPQNYLMRVSVQTDPVLEPGEPERLSLFPVLGDRAGRPNYKFDPNGRRFLFRQNRGIDSRSVRESKVVVILNWVEWLKTEVPTQ